MWFESTTEKDVNKKHYTAVYPEIAMERLQDGLIAAVSALSGLGISKEQANDTRIILLGFLNDIRQSKFISVGFTDKLKDLINKEINNE